jgi:cytoskeletal protein CcmA (bactofilin family)
MGQIGGTLDRASGAENVRRAGAESLGLLKAATGFAKGKTPGFATTSAPKIAPDAPKQTSVMSINVEMAGTIVSPDELHIFGAFEGNIRASAITIGAGGSVKGEVVAEIVVVNGAVDGRIHGQKVQIGAGGVVRGDIIHAALGIDLAATFEGASKRTQNPMADAPSIVASKRV